jgi:hypothetical protein
LRVNVMASDNRKHSLRGEYAFAVSTVVEAHGSMPRQAGRDEIVPIALA